MESAKDLIEKLNIMDESTRIEAKKGSAIDKSIMETVCSLSNEPGLDGGYIILGVVNDEQSLFPSYSVIGIENPDKLQMDFASQCASIFNIPLRPEVEVETINGLNVLKILVNELPAAQKPVYFKDEKLPRGAYRRIGSTDQRCSEDDLVVFFNQSETFDNSIVLDSSMADIDENAVIQYRNLRAKVNPYAEELSFTDEDLLSSLGCIKKNDSKSYLTYTGLLVFGKTIAQRRLLPAMRVDYIRVPGTTWVSDPDNRFTTLDMRGPLILLIQRAYNTIADDLPKGFLLPEGQIQATSIGLPGRVLREALVNALIHRSYRVNQPVQIIRYSNRIEIANPGFSLKPEDHLGEPGSNQRNPFIAAIFHETNLAETKGSGIRTMRRLMEAHAMTPPTFESDHSKNLFTARLLLHHFLSESDINWLVNFERYELNNDQKKALIFLKEVGAIDNSSFRQITGLDVLKASSELRTLKDLELLSPKGKGKSTYYIPGDDLIRFLDLSIEEEQKLLEPIKNNVIKTSPLNLIIPTKVLIEPVKQTIEPVKDTNEPAKVVNVPPAKDVVYDIEPAQEKYLDELPYELRKEVLSIPKRSNDRDSIDKVIIELCRYKDYSLKDLAAILNRAEKHLLHNYITPLRVTGKIKYTVPDMPNHPEQAYTAIKR